MTRFLTLAANDFRLQFRYGIYYAYAFVIGFYVLVLIYGASYFPSWLPGFVIFTDPAAIGFFFLGALMMLEKGENTRNALAMTPISALAYFGAKCATLTGLALVAVTVLTPFLHSGANWPMLLASVALTSIFSLGIGVPAALYFKSVTSFLIGAAGWLIPIIVPGFLALMDPMPVWAFLIPSAAQFKLILVAVGAHSASNLEISALFLVAILAALGSSWLAVSRLKKVLGK